MLGLFFTLTLSTGGRALAGADQAPNFIVVLTDDQGYGDFGSRGNPHLKTPVLDRFAEESVFLPRFYCSPVCAPTRASLLTGRYYYRSGVIHTSRGGSKMHGDEVTLAELLGRLGYRTGIFGKWHLGDNYPMRPNDQGFDESLIHKSSAIGNTPDAPNSYWNPTLWRDGRRVESEGYCTDVFTDAAIDFVVRHADRPFFLYLPYNAPHTPLDVDDRYADPYRAMGLNETTSRIYGMLANLDENIGRLLHALDRLNLADNTVICFFGDNGPQQSRYNAGLRMRKGSIYDGGIRVGAYVRWPGRFPAGHVVERIAAHIDIAPTFMELAERAGATAPEDLGSLPAFDGRSLVPLLEGRGDAWPDRTLFFQCHRSLEPRRYQHMAVMTDRYKLVGYPGTFSEESLDTASRPPVLELYDLISDPGESRDLAEDYPEKVTDLLSRYEAWFDDVRATRNFTPGVIVIDDEKERPTLLCRYQDGEWRGGAPRGWSVEITRGGRYRVSIDRGAVTGRATLHLAWQGEERQVPLFADLSTAEFDLVAGRGILDVFLIEQDSERVFDTTNQSSGNVTIQRTQGQRVLTCYSGKDLHEVVIAPAARAAPHGHAVLVGALFQ